MRFLFSFVSGAIFASVAVAQIPGAGSASSESTRALTLPEAVALASTQHPDVAAVESELRAREGRLLQARTRSNPELSAEVENLGGDAAQTGGTQSTLQLAQRFELGGDRGARIAAAVASRDIALWDLRARRLEVASRATRAFVDVLAAQRRLELATNDVRLTDEVRKTVAARVEAGKVSPIEETRAEVALATERIEERHAAAEVVAARARLAAALGNPEQPIASAAGDFPFRGPVPPLEEVVAGIERHPYVARWSAEIAEREAMLRVEHALAVPDVTVGGGYRHFEVGGGAAVATASIPLPFLDRNRGARTAARERIAAARQERSAALLRLEGEVATAHAALVSADVEVRALREEVVPGAESVYAAVSEGYRLGKFGYLEVLDARRTLVAARVQLLRAEKELQQQSVELQRLTATMPGLITDGEKN